MQTLFMHFILVISKTNASLQHQFVTTTY